MNTNSMMKIGLTMGGLGLVGWALARRRRHHAEHATLTGLVDRLRSLMPALRAQVGEPAEKSAEQAPAADVGRLRDMLSRTGPDALQKAVAASFSGFEPVLWHDFGLALFHALQSQGVGNSMVCNELGLSTNNVYAMSGDDFGRLLAWTRRTHPSLLDGLLENRVWMARALGVEETAMR
jgi:hypothetical protein